jgi:DNA-binding MarR family transcriptional regulator
MFICDISVLNKYGKALLDEMLRPLNAEWRELVVMLVIEQAPGITQARLSPMLQTDKANVSKMLRQMEDKGLIRRVAADEDQRNNTCSLTGMGQERLPEYRRALERWEAACFQNIDDTERLQFELICERITVNLLGKKVM